MLSLLKNSGCLVFYAVFLLVDLLGIPYIKKTIIIKRIAMIVIESLELGLMYQLWKNVSETTLTVCKKPNIIKPSNKPLLLRIFFSINGTKLPKIPNIPPRAKYNKALSGMFEHLVLKLTPSKVSV